MQPYGPVQGSGFYAKVGGGEFEELPHPCGCKRVAFDEGMAEVSLHHDVRLGVGADPGVLFEGRVHADDRAFAHRRVTDGPLVGCGWRVVLLGHFRAVPVLLDELMLG